MAGNELLQHNLSPESAAPLTEAIAEIGIGELTHTEVQERYASVSNQLDIGLSRQGRPTREDGGVLAIRTPIPLITPEAYTHVPTGKRVLTAEFGGTNLKINIAEKQQNGSIEQAQLYEQSFALDERQVTFAQYIDIMAEPLDRFRHLAGGDSFDFGFSFGLAHENSVEPYGLEVNLLSEKNNGVLVKGWHIRDWSQIPPSERGVIGAINRRLGNNGSGIGINDTPAVALDRGAALGAQREGYRVLDGAAVAGTGTNGAVFIGEMVNTEIGHALWPDDPVSARLRRRLIDQGIFTDEQDVPELEHETGQYIARRVAAAVDLLGERGLMPMAQILAEQIESGINTNPALISELAAGKTRITVDNSSTIILQALAQSAQRRAEQVYGIFFASLASPIMEEQTDTVALLTEGSTIHKGMSDATNTLKEGAEKEAKALLEQELIIYPASGMNGIAAVAMSWEALRNSS